MPAPWPSTGFSSKASTATRQNSSRPAPESWVKCCSGWLGNCRSGLENWSQARPPTAIAAPIASTRRRPGRPASAPAGCGRARAPVRSAPPCRRSSRRRPANSASASSDAGDAGSAAPSRPGRRRRWSRRGSRRGCRAPAPRAPPAAAPRAPIASVASSQRRSWERAIRQPQATSRASRPPRE